MTTKIKIRVSPDPFGLLTLKPVSDRVCKRVAASNKHDGCADVYLQTDVRIDDLLNSLTSAQRKNIKSGWDVHILMDEYTYRHQYVGGQIG